MDEQEREQRARQAGRIFTPAVPVSEAELFAGRMAQIQRVVDVINQRGQHAVIFGERGVGKTSLANILASRLAAPGIEVVAPRVNCDSTDDFGAVWRKVLSQMEVIKTTPVAGFRSEPLRETLTASSALGDAVTPDDVRRLLAALGESQLLVVILDEFDRLTNAAARRAMADTVKALADHDVPVTLVVVGVADTVEELIAQHASIERAIVQVPMRRMSPAELEGILTKGAARLEMEVAPPARRQIALLSQGLPHYTHLLGLHAVRVALAAGSSTVTPGHVRDAVARAVGDAEQSLRSDVRRALAGSERGQLYGHVLLASALAEADAFGYFAPADVRRASCRVLHQARETRRFSKHLDELCQPGRGGILARSGEPRRHRYRFARPLMQPLIIMKALVDGRIDEALLPESA